MITQIIPLNNLLFSRDPASSGKRQITQIRKQRVKSVQSF